MVSPWTWPQVASVNTAMDLLSCMGWQVTCRGCTSAESLCLTWAQSYQHQHSSRLQVSYFLSLRQTFYLLSNLASTILSQYWYFIITFHTFWKMYAKVWIIKHFYFQWRPSSMGSRWVWRCIKLRQQCSSAASLHHHHPRTFDGSRMTDHCNWITEWLCCHLEAWRLLMSTILTGVPTTV